MLDAPTSPSPDDPLTPEVLAFVGIETERVLASPEWGIEREGLRTFVNAIMDPDPRQWDENFAATTRYGGIVAPPIYCTYLWQKTPAGEEDPIGIAFRGNPDSDGIGGLREGENVRGVLPLLPTGLKRILNAGNEIEVYRYPSLGDRIYSQARYADIRGRNAKDGSRMLIVVTETVYTDQDEHVLCVLRHSTIRR